MTLATLSFPLSSFLQKGRVGGSKEFHLIWLLQLRDYSPVPLSRVISVSFSLVYSRIKAALGINGLDLRLRHNGIHI